METNHIKLANNFTSFTHFEKDQVLTSKQLNQVVGYLDQQTRLTRVKLHGAGIVCGLQVKSDSDGIKITKGAAITTDGDMLHLDKDHSYKFVNNFEDKNANYPAFIKNGKQIQLFEMLADKKTAPKAKSFKQFTSGLNMNDTAVILYNESYLFDPDICTGSNCDNMGQVQKNNLKVLLVKKNNLSELLDQMPDAGNAFSKLPNIFIERVKLKPSKINSTGQLTSNYNRVINNTVKELNSKLPKIYSAASEILEYKNDPTGKMKNQLTSISNSVSSGSQYIYNFLRDLINTYSEFKDELFEAGNYCSLDYKIFPKHILLGSVVGNDAKANEKFRHKFYPSPTLSLGNEKIARAKFLFRKIEMLIDRFSIPNQSDEIKITPSKSNNNKLSERSIPYYYKPKGEAGTINNFWNYDYSKRDANDLLLSFNASNYSDVKAIKDPLSFDLNGYDFFRIEGHLNSNVERAEEKIKNIIEENNLPIKIEKVQIEDITVNIRPRPGYNLSWLKNYHYLLRRDLIDNLQNLKVFNDGLNNTIQSSNNGGIPKGALKDPSINITKFTKDSSKKLDENIDSNINNLKKGYSKFDHQTYKTNFPILLETASSVNKNTKNVLYSSAFTPVENIISNSKFKWFDWIGKLLKEKEEDDKRKQTFAGFSKEHPGVEHRCGVDAGGTFVLVYEKNSKKVVADFSLPYFIAEIEVDDKEIEKEIEVDNNIGNLLKDKTKWNNLNDFQVYISKDYEFIEKFKNLDEKILNFNNKFEVFDHKIASQSDSLKVYSGSLTELTGNIQRIIGGGFSSGKFLEGLDLHDKELNESARLLNEMNGIIELIDSREKEGRTTPKDKELRKNIEKSAGEILLNSFEKIGGRAGDVIEGSAEAEFIKKTKSLYGSFADKNNRKKFKDKLTELKNNSAGKNNFINYLNGF